MNINISRYKNMQNVQNSQILKGSAIEIFFSDDNLNDVCPLFATEHTFTMNVETIEISTKSHGDYPAVLPQRITWNMTSNNLMSDNAQQAYMKWASGMKKVTVKFAEVNNYAPYDDDGGAERGIVDNDHAEWELGRVLAQGKAIIDNLEINASSGDNATLSISMRGTSDLEWEENGTYTISKIGSGAPYVALNKQYANQSETITITPLDGYSYSYFTFNADPATVTPTWSSTYYSFSMPASDVNLLVTYSEE